jgi:hypothetical protein
VSVLAVFMTELPLILVSAKAIHHEKRENRRHRHEPDIARFL